MIDEYNSDSCPALHFLTHHTDHHYLITHCNICSQFSFYYDTWGIIQQTATYYKPLRSVLETPFKMLTALFHKNPLWFSFCHIKNHLLESKQNELLLLPLNTTSYMTSAAEFLSTFKPPITHKIIYFLQYIQCPPTPCCNYCRLRETTYYLCKNTIGNPLTEPESQLESYHLHLIY